MVEGHLVLDTFINSTNLVMGLNLECLVLVYLNINCNNIARNDTNHIKYLCNLFNMEQLIQEPTSVTPTICSKNLIDVIITSMCKRHKIIIKTKYLIKIQLLN